MRCAAAVAAVAMLVAACVGSGEGVPYADPDEIGGAPTSFEAIQAGIFDLRCAPQCHSGGGASQGLALERGRSIASLVGVPSSEVPSLKRVDPGRSGDSYLVVKLSPADPRRIGNRMPRTGPPFLTAAEIRGVRRWIDQGAASDWVDDGDDPSVPDDDDSAGGLVPLPLEAT